MWENEEEMRWHQTIAKVLCVFFTWSSLCAFISIIQTIRTDPGKIPDETVWKIQSWLDSENAESDPKTKTDNIFQIGKENQNEELKRDDWSQHIYQQENELGKDDSKEYHPMSPSSTEKR